VKCPAYSESVFTADFYNQPPEHKWLKCLQQFHCMMVSYVEHLNVNIWILEISMVMNVI
jgi:hypothetical protein